MGLVVAAVGVVALVGMSAMAVQALVSGGRGAASPEAAVDRLADAIAAEDAVATAAALAPDEVGSLATLLAEIEEHAQETGFAPAGDTFAGIDLTAEGLTYEVEELDDGVARVEVTGGRVGYSFDPGQLSERTRELLGDDVEPSSDEAEVAEAADDPPYLVAVRRDGGWFVSIVHTIAEYAVDGLDLPDADHGEVLERDDPASDPEAAVVDLIEALVAGDLEAVASRLSEDATSVLAPYRDTISDALDDMVDAGSFTVSDVEVEAAEELDDGARRVRIVGAEGTFGAGDEEVGWELDGLCVRFDGFGEYEDEYAFDPDAFANAIADEMCALVEETYIGRLLPPGGPSVVVVPERGGWVVSPTETVLLAVRDVLPQLDHDTIVTLAGRPDLVAPEGEAPFGEVFEVALGEAGVATRTVSAPGGAEVVVSVGDDEAEAFVVRADGEEVEPGDVGFVLEEGVEHRLVVRRLSRSGDAPVTVALGQVLVDDLGEVSLAGTVTGTLSPAEPARRASFTLDREVSAEIAVDGDVFVDVYEDGELVCSDGDDCDFEPGPAYELVVQRPDGAALDEDPVDYEVAFDVRVPPPPGSATEATIDGRSNVSGVLEEGGSAFHEVVVPDGARVVVLVEASDPDQDVDAYFDDEFHEDSGDERFVLDGPVDGELEVFLYTEGPTGYTVTLEPA